MSEAVSTLCQACGFCCDGTLFDGIFLTASDVIVERWQKFTGRKAERISNPIAAEMIVPSGSTENADDGKRT